VLAEGSYQELFGYSTETPTLNINDENVAEKNNTDNVVKYYIHDRPHKPILNPVTSSDNEIKTLDVNHPEPVEIVETHSTGNVAFSVYFTYIFAGGHFCKVLGLFLICILTQVLSSGADYWITYW